MVRKSTKTNVAEKTTRKRRGTRRRKDSSSESESEANPPPREENVSTISLPKDPKEGDEVDASSRLRNRRASKRNAANKDELPQEEPEKVNTAPGTEWNEDETFWTGGAASSAAVSNSGAKEDEGTTWKIQSSNGSGGEIQKLKICRQRPTDSTGSPSPAKDCASPKIKRMAVPEKDDGELTELDLDTPMDVVDVETEKIQQEEILVAQNIIIEEIPKPDDTLGPLPEEIKNVQHEEIIIPGLDLVSEGQKPEDRLWLASEQIVTEVSMIEMPPSREEPEEQLRSIVISKEQLPTNIETTQTVEVKEIVEEEVESSCAIGACETMDLNIDEVIMPKDDEILVPETIMLPEEVVAKDVEEEEEHQEDEEEEEEGGEGSGQTANVDVAAVTAAEEEENDEGDEKKLPIDEEVPTSVQTNATNKTLTGTSLSVSSEAAMEQIAKRLNERAARVKEVSEEKEKISSVKSNVLSRENSPDLDRSIEEGEIVSSAAATPDPQQPSKSASKATPSTTLVNKPKEVDCLVTKLKRNIEENPPEGRKRRVSKKRLCLSQQISISSDVLKTLAPDIQPVSLEDLEFGTESDGAEEGSVEPQQEEPETKEPKRIKTSPEKYCKKCDDVQVTLSISNDLREVKKKKPIVIESRRSRSPGKRGKSPQGPKLPTQENHKATRKISIVSADAKALRKSPSPSRKKPTEVLFITNLVRPFTVPQLRELLARTGTIAQNGFYIDKIKSKCYVKYTDIEMAIETRHALHGVRWPVNNPKTLRVDFALPEDMAVVQKLADEEAAGAGKKQEPDSPITTIPGGGAGIGPGSGPTTGGTGSSVAGSGGGGGGGGWLNEQAALKPSRRVTASVREWDMGKVVGGEAGIIKTSPPALENKKKIEDDWSRKKEKSSRPEKERDRRRAHSPEHNKAEPPKKIKKKDVDAPAKLLDDLFRKTKATPCIYWLPLTAAQIAVKEEMRRQHMAEHERRLAELRKTDAGSRRDNKDRDRERDRRKK